MPVRRIREDRVLDEARATRGDVRRLCDLFGLSIKAAERYTAAVRGPGIVEPGQGSPTREPRPAASCPPDLRGGA